MRGVIEVCYYVAQYYACYCHNKIFRHLPARLAADVDALKCTSRNGSQIDIKIVFRVVIWDEMGQEVSSSRGVNTSAVPASQAVFQVQVYSVHKTDLTRIIYLTGGFDLLNI